MDENQVFIDTGYPAAQLAKAFTTARHHEDAATREAAAQRLRTWRDVIAGMSDGTLAVGSRTPVAGLPAWVTPEVVRGGFATGDAAAGGPPTAHELATARQARLPGADRAALFRHHLTDAGLAELDALLDSGHYEVDVPEEAALLTVAWLLRSGDRLAALTLVDEIRPFADRLRFAPRPTDTRAPDGSVVHRETVGDVRAALRARRPQAAVAAMNEALAVWNPFADRLLEHWLETVSDGVVARVEPDGWRERGRELLARYRVLASTHTLCTKHRKPKENVAILRSALEELLADTGRPRPLSPRTLGRLRHAVDAMVARRGRPGSARHGELRARQAADAARVTWYELAQLLLARLGETPDAVGLPATDWVVAPLTRDEADSLRPGVAAGGGIPDAMARVVLRALSAPVATLVERGVIPSAEVLADLVPRLVASTTALDYHDEALRTLVAATYRAFANRRSLLLVNLQHQVGIDELPWLRAVRPYRRPTGDSLGHARTALVEIAALTLRAFPATILPNPMIRQLGTLARQARIDVPFTEELAADIFMGTFSDKFLRAAHGAADVLEGSLYARYYGIDYAAIRALGSRGTSSVTPFAALCRERAGVPRGGSWVAANGTVIEQAQILTTHNLAALVHPVGMDAGGAPDLARAAFAGVCRLVRQVDGNPRPLGTIKDAAYAWRQAVFFMALCGLEDQITVMAAMQDHARRQPDHAVRRLSPVLTGLRHVLAGGGLDDGDAPAHARRFLGWSTDGHWMRRV
ncbi:hypothetical protein LO772_23655 [Yinghuangia sp. ASG 101]|uniref:hypothetical protein n=1 Tax=Yinghuangia sp. ASG 101 TaxID=2896848 RepID=UPI001E452197|nr:hypothetical protein [Yinghuangia sp. ASG 101]UGQ09877.1 hypothetical protein LO772_23655 [Yinghuangia sp. ASG 101]